MPGRHLGAGRNRGCPLTRQLTYLSRRAAWFWWDPDGFDDEYDRPPGRPATVRLAIPDGGEVRVLPVSGLQAELDAGWAWLHSQTGSGTSESVLAWARLVVGADPDTVATALPPAGHCEPRPQGDGIRGARAVIDDVLQTRSVGHDLARSGFAGQLRGYQLAGVAWLAARKRGAVLADEMGLGKTVQALALMTLRADRPHLVICPASLVANWTRETHTYAPRLRPNTWTDPATPSSVTIVSYDRLRMTPPDLRHRGWDVVVVDEAQQVKNGRTLAHRAVADLPAGTKIVMTGTPVENTLDDFWSLSNIAQPGGLGTRRQFRERIALPLQRRGSHAAAARLAHRSHGLLLRRTKAEVAADLPPKQLVDVPCDLTAEQGRLYQQTVDRVFEAGFGSSRRRASILALLTQVKQICNHPAQLLGQTRPLPGRSGKFDQLISMLDEAHGAGTAVLVFTQYVTMGRLIADHLNQTGPPARFLHGQLRLATRDRIVEEFQAGHGSAILIVSLRAAGFGLNLTRASTVIHYDRWWNPAVEDQASDRVHRIGQDKPVTIYTLRAAGTIEDHIHALHAHKRGLADTLGSEPSPHLLTLPDDQLHQVLRLDPSRSP